MKKYPLINRPRTMIPKNAKLVFDDKKILQVYQYEQTMFDETKQIYTKSVLRDAAFVFAVSGSDIIYSIQQQSGEPEPFIDIPGGFIDDGEKPEVAAIRELREEVGYTSNNLFKLFEYNKSDKFANTEHIYIAYDCKNIAAQHLDACEKITPMRAPIRDFVYDVMDDKIFRKPWLRQYFTKDFTRDMLIELLERKHR